MDSKYLGNRSLLSVRSDNRLSHGVSMILKRNFNFSRFSVLGIMLLLLLATINTGQTVLAEEVEQRPPITIEEIASEASEQESSESIEEIVVYGDKPLGALRRDVYKSEENFFDLFNSLNQDFEYDVNCYYEVPSFTHIRHHVCRANFVVEATSVQYVEIRTRGPRYPTVPPELVIAKKKKILRQKMEALVAEHPELLQALTEYTRKRTTLESARDKR